MMRARGSVASLLALPALLGVALLASVFVASSRGESAGASLVQETRHVSEGAGEPGWGYVRSAPDGARDDVDEREEADALEQAQIMAMLGAGWERGEMLAEDLELLVAAARSQLELYQDHLERLRAEGAPGETIELTETGIREARGQIEAFRLAGERLRTSMVRLRESVE